MYDVHFVFACRQQSCLIGCSPFSLQLRGSASINRELQVDQAPTDLCASIIAVAGTRDPNYDSSIDGGVPSFRRLIVGGGEEEQQRQLEGEKAFLEGELRQLGKRKKEKNRNVVITGSPSSSPIETAISTDSVEDGVLEEDYDEAEEFLCELSSNGELIPLSGSVEQLDTLRVYLNNGDMVSAETTIEGLTEADVVDESAGAMFDVGTGEGKVVNLPVGSIKLKPGSGNHSRRRLKPLALDEDDNNNSNSSRRLATYEGKKDVLVIRVIDSKGLAHPDSARVMSDKIFGTDGDTATMTSQFNACSFGKLTISNDYSVDISKEESAKGVVEVNINVDITTSAKGVVRR